MRIRFGTVIVAAVALAVGAAAGWLAAVLGGSVNVKMWKCANMEAANDGRASAPNGRAVSMKPPKEKAKPRRAAKANVEKQRDPEAVKQEEKPAQEENAAQKKNDNPFPRYLDMFKNNPEALAAEFAKEAEKDRAYQREMRDGIIDELKLNAEQAAVFEKALDDLRDKITQENWERVDLITSGQMNDETAADGCIWSSNRILQYKLGAARWTLISNTAEKLYEQLELDGVSNANKQEFLFWAARQTSFSYECLEPNLKVYDKVYKNMGVGNGIFSWCRRPQQKGKKQ